MGSESFAGRERRLAERVEVRESEVHGRGLFARKRLRKGQLIGRFEGEPTQEDGTHVLWLIDEEGDEIGIRGCNALRFLNHGEPPNAEFRADELYALRNLQPGAELLIDYAPDFGEELGEPVEARASDRAERGKRRRAVRVAGCVGLLALVLSSAGCAGRIPDGLGVREGRLAPCPSSPNCVSSEAVDPGHAIDALGVEGTLAAAWQGLRALLEGSPRVRIVTDEVGYIHAVFTTRIMRYRDDVEFHARRDRNEIAVRSASRVGYDDLGANRKRIEWIRAELTSLGLVRAARE